MDKRLLMYISFLSQYVVETSTVLPSRFLIRLTAVFSFIYANVTPFFSVSQCI